MSENLQAFFGRYTEMLREVGVLSVEQELEVKRLIGAEVEREREALPQPKPPPLPGGRFGSMHRLLQRESHSPDSPE